MTLALHLPHHHSSAEFSPDRRYRYQLVRARTVTSRLWKILCRTGGALAAFGWTANHQPRHPLYLPRTCVLQCLTAGDDGDADEERTAIVTTLHLRRRPRSDRSCT